MSAKKTPGAGAWPGIIRAWGEALCCVEGCARDAVWKLGEAEPINPEADECAGLGWLMVCAKCCPR